MNETKVQASLSRIVAGINQKVNRRLGVRLNWRLDGNDRKELRWQRK